MLRCIRRFRTLARQLKQMLLVDSLSVPPGLTSIIKLNDPLSASVSICGVGFSSAFSVIASAEPSYVADLGKQGSELPACDSLQTRMELIDASNGTPNLTTRQLK
jgi:hypothetical protein